MLASLTTAPLASELRLVAHDLFTILRPISRLFTSLDDYSFLAIRLDHWLHLATSILLVVVLARIISRRNAVLVALAIMVLKEAIDIPAKLRFLTELRPIQIHIDSAWDFAFGLLGIGAGLLLLILLGPRWRTRPVPAHAIHPGAAGIPACPPAHIHTTTPLSLPGRGQGEGCVVNPVHPGGADIPACPAAPIYAVLFLGPVALFAGFLLAGGLSKPEQIIWLAPLLAAALTVLACWKLGPANALLLAMPLLPLANWLQNRLAPFRFNAGSAILVALLAWEAIRRLRTRERRLPVDRSDALLAIYAALASLIVLVNCFRLGWTSERSYWLIPLVTGLAAYFLAKDLLADPRLLRRAIALLAASFGLIAIIGIVEFLASPLRLEEIPGSVFEGAPHFSVYLALLWPFLLALALSGIRPRALFWPCVALGAAAIVLVFVRSCWAAACAAALLLLVIRLLRRDWLFGLACAGGMAAVLILLAWSVRTVSAQEHTPFRSRLVREAASILAPGSYERARSGVIEAAQSTIDASPILGTTGRSAHTLHQAFLINYGIPAAILAALAILVILGYGWVRAARAGDPIAFAITAGATAAVVASILEGLGWSPVVRSSLQPLLWYLLGLVPASIAAAQHNTQPASPPDPSRRLRPLS